MKKSINYKNYTTNANSLRILNKLSKIRNGAYFKIQYYTDLESHVRAEYKNQYTVTKLTQISVRKGINYENLKAVKQKRLAEAMQNGGIVESKRESYYNHLDSVLVQHKTSGKLYLQLFPNVNGHAQTQYYLNGKSISAEDLKDKDILRPSYWNRKDSGQPVLTFTLGLDKVTEVY